MDAQAKHIALFTRTLRGGGVERVIANLANEFALRGYRVDMVLAEADGVFLKDLKPSVRVVGLDAPRLRQYTLGLARYLCDQQPDALLSASDECNLAAIWARALVGAPTRVVISSHSTLSRYVPNSRYPKVKLLPALIRLFYRFADGVIAVSGGVADDLAKVSHLPRNRIHVVHNASVTAEIIERKSWPIPHAWFEDKSHPLIVAVGRLRPAKDFHLLINAFSKVYRRRPARLMIVGEGDLRPELEALTESLGLSEVAVMPGFVEDPFPYMAHSSLFVLSSAWEGLPTAVIEALACGCTIVSTDCRSGPREILDDGVYGALVPVGDADQLAAAILLGLDHPADAARQRRRAWDFTPGPSADRYLSILLPNDV